MVAPVEPRSLFVGKLFSVYRTFTTSRSSGQRMIRGNRGDLRARSVVATDDGTLPEGRCDPSNQRPQGGRSATASSSPANGSPDRKHDRRLQFKPGADSHGHQGCWRAGHRGGRNRCDVFSTSTRRRTRLHVSTSSWFTRAVYGSVTGNERGRAIYGGVLDPIPGRQDLHVQAPPRHEMERRCCGSPWV